MYYCLVSGRKVELPSSSKNFILILENRIAYGINDENYQKAISFLMKNPKAKVNIGIPKDPGFYLIYDNSTYSAWGYNAPGSHKPSRIIFMFK